MTTKLHDLVKVATVTTGTGAVRTDGLAAAGYLTFALGGVVDGETVTYNLSEGSQSEVGHGVYNASGNSLTRNVLKSTNGDTAIVLAGSAVLSLTVAAEDFVTDTLTDVAFPKTAPNDRMIVAYDHATGKFIPASAAAASYPMDIGFDVEGLTSNAEVVGRFTFARAAQIAAGASGSAKAGTAATGSTTYTLKKNGSSIGTAIFGVGGTVATISITSLTTVVAGDQITLVGPATADATLANVGFTFSFTR